MIIQTKEIKTLFLKIVFQKNKTNTKEINKKLSHAPREKTKRKVISKKELAIINKIFQRRFKEDKHSKDNPKNKG